MKFHAKETKTKNYLNIQLKQKPFKDKVRKESIMKITVKKNLLNEYMPIIPKDLRTPNFKSGYGKAKIRKYFNIIGGKNESNNVKKEAKSQGWEGKTLRTAYRHLGFVVDMFLETERDKWIKGQKKVLVSFTLVAIGYFSVKGKYKFGKKYDRYVKKEVKQSEIKQYIHNQKMKFKDEIDEKYGEDLSPFDKVEVYQTGYSTFKDARYNFGYKSKQYSVMKDFASLNQDHYIKNEVWDKGRNMCVVDFIKYRYKNQRGLIKPLKLNDKKYTEKESDDAIQLYSTHQEVDYKKEYEIVEDLDANPNKNGYTAEHIKLFCENMDLNMVALIDGEIVMSAFNKNKSKYKSLVFEIKNNHLYPIVEPRQIKWWSDKAQNIISSNSQKSKADPKKNENNINDIVFKQKGYDYGYEPYTNSKVPLNKVQYALEIMIREKCYTHFPTRMVLYNGQLSFFDLQGKRYLMEQEESEIVKQTIEYCKQKEIKYIGQPPQFFSAQFLTSFKCSPDKGGNSKVYKSYMNTQVREALLQDKVLYRTHMGAFADSEELYSKEWIDKYNHSVCYDINKCYRDVMTYPIEDWAIIPFHQTISKFQGEIGFGLYYVRTNDMTLLHQSNWYSSAMVKYAIKENVISKNDIKYFIQAERVEPRKLSSIIDTIDKNMEGFDKLKKLTINSIYGLLAKTESTRTQLWVDEDINSIFKKYAGVKGLKKENIQIQKHYTNSFKNKWIHKIQVPDDCLNHINSFLPPEDRARIVYTYGETNKMKYMSNNLPMAIQILDQANIKLYQMAKESQGEILWRKTDCLMVYNGKEIETSSDIGGYRIHEKPMLETIKPMNQNRCVEYRHHIYRWEDLKYINSDNWLNIIDAFYKNKGGMLIGRAGTGKSFVSIQGGKHFDKMGIKHKSLAFTNKATIQLKGFTIHNFLKIDADGKINQQWAKEVCKTLKVIFIDEISMISSHLWCLLCELKMMTNITFILIGDYRQLPPVENLKVDWFNHPAIHYLTNSMRCELTEMKRYDEELWDLLEDIWENGNLDFFTKTEDFEDDELLNGTNICYKNYTRKLINEKCMNIKWTNDAIPIKWFGKQDAYQQDAWLYAGMPLLMFITTKDKKFKKNEAVRIVSVNDDTFTITNDIDEISFKVSDFHMKCLVGYATTIHKSQGDTIDGKLNIFDSSFLTSDWFHKKGGELDARKAIYTALSRAKMLNNIKVCRKITQKDTDWE